MADWFKQLATAIKMRTIVPIRSGNNKDVKWDLIRNFFEAADVGKHAFIQSIMTFITEYNFDIAKRAVRLKSITASTVTELTKALETIPTKTFCSVLLAYATSKKEGEKNTDDAAGIVTDAAEQNEDGESVPDPKSDDIDDDGDGSESDE